MTSPPPLKRKTKARQALVAVLKCYHYGSMNTFENKALLLQTLWLSDYLLNEGYPKELTSERTLHLAARLLGLATSALPLDEMNADFSGRIWPTRSDRWRPGSALKILSSGARYNLARAPECSLEVLHLLTLDDDPAVRTAAKAAYAPRAEARDCHLRRIQEATRDFHDPKHWAHSEFVTPDGNVREEFWAWARDLVDAEGRHFPEARSFINDVALTLGLKRARMRYRPVDPQELMSA